MGPKFEEIPKNPLNLLMLEEILNRALPQSVHLLVLCRIARLNGFPADVSVDFYRYTEHEHGLLLEAEKIEDEFIVCIQHPNIHTRKGTILLSPLTPKPSMILALDHLIDWSESQAFHCVQPQLWEHLQILCTAHHNQNPENSKGVPAIFHSILDVNQAKSLEVSIPSPIEGHNFHIRPLEDKDVAEVVEQYKWRVSHSEQVIRSCIKVMPSCGLFIRSLKHPKEDEEMVSSVVQSPLGLFNILYTPEKHRRKGYGKICMEWVTKQAALVYGIPPICEVESWNIPSKKLLEKVGLVEMCHTKWFFYDPPRSQS